MSVPSPNHKNLRPMTFQITYPRLGPPLFPKKRVPCMGCLSLPVTTRFTEAGLWISRLGVFQPNVYCEDNFKE